MAKKSGSNWSGIASFCAFFSIVISGVLFMVNAILKMVGGSINGGILSMIATILMAAGLIIPGWLFTKGKAMWVKVLFWVCAIILIVFGVLGFTLQ